MIAEVMQTPIAGVSGQWLELTNTTGHSVDVSGWLLGLPGGPAAMIPYSPSVTTISPHGHLVVCSVDDPPLSTCDVAFSGLVLPPEGQIELRNPSGDSMDTANYPPSPIITVFFFTIARSVALKNVGADNALPDNWAISEEIIDGASTLEGVHLGTPGAPNTDIGSQGDVACNEDPDDPCTVDTCVDGACAHAPVGAGCCATDADCPSFPCMPSACVNGQCHASEPIPGCCTSDADCSDGDPCTEDHCTEDDVCATQAIAGCCHLDAECSDGDPCTQDLCESDGACAHPPVAGCCTLDTECDDGDGCTDDACVNGACDHGIAEGCCDTAADCTVHSPCRVPECSDGLCVYPDVCNQPCQICISGDCTTNPGTCFGNGQCVEVGDPLPGDGCFTCMDDGTFAPVTETFVADLDMLGGSTSDVGEALAIAGSGRVVAAGAYSGSPTVFPPNELGSIMPLPPADGVDAYVVTYEANGSVSWTAALGGAGSQRAEDVAIVVTGPFMNRVAVVGAFDDGLQIPGEPHVASAGQSDLFIAAYDAGGSLDWFDAAGSAGDDRALAVTISDYGTVIVTGTFGGDITLGQASNPITLHGNPGMSRSFFLAAYDKDGGLLYARTALSGDVAEGTAITHDGDEVIVAGSFRGDVELGFLGQCSDVLSSAGAEDIFVARYNSWGYCVQARRFGGSETDAATAVQASDAGAIVLAGWFESPTLDGSPSWFAPPLTRTGDRDGFLATMGEGLPESFAHIGGTPGSRVEPRALAIDDGPLFVAGRVEGSIALASGGSSQESAGSGDLFLAPVEPGGGTDMAILVGGSSDDAANGVVLLGGFVLVTGYFGGPADLCACADGGLDAPAAFGPGIPLLALNQPSDACSQSPWPGPGTNGLSCIDNDSCTIDETWEDGWCVGQTYSCGPDSPCRTYSCDGVGGCIVENLPDGTACDDGDPCTESDTCAAGWCNGAPIQCEDDGDLCTYAVCTPQEGCTQVPRDCMDGNCTIGVCNPLTGDCEMTPACETWGDPCYDTYCNSGTCWPVPTCQDGDPCTLDWCSGGDCTYEPMDCEDGDPCSVDLCVGGACELEPTCDDQDPCTMDSCIGGDC